jgi:RNA polymerase sigma-70 factor (ECF subfamily)
VDPREGASVEVADDRTALLRRLYVEHAEALTRRMFRLCGDAEVARDLTQDAFLIALREPEAFRGEAQLGTWLQGIAYNLLRDHRRTHRRRRGLWQRWRSRHATPAASTAVSATEQPLLERLQRALDGLDEAQRDAFVLRIVEGLSLEQTAEIVGAPVSTVSYRATAAEKKVRAHFEGESS